MLLLACIWRGAAIIEKSYDLRILYAIQSIKRNLELQDTLEQRL